MPLPPKLPPLKNLALYQIITSSLAEVPDLSCIQACEPCPQSWPLLLVEIQTFRRQVLGFVVSDGKRRVFCRTSITEVYNKLAAMGEGAIIHLVGSKPVFFESQKAYGLELDNVISLKEYDDELKQQQKAEAKRLERLRQSLDEEGYFAQMESTVFERPSAGN
jgi:hypothetical protein